MVLSKQKGLYSDPQDFVWLVFFEIDPFTGLELREGPAFASRIVGLKAYTTMSAQRGLAEGPRKFNEDLWKKGVINN